MLTMRNKEKRPHAKDGTERGQKGPRPAGLAHFQAQSASVFFSAKYSSTLACVLPKPPTRTAYIYPEAAVKEGGSQRDSEESIQRRVSEIHSS